MKAKTKMLVASWLVYVSKGSKPFRVMKLGSARKICMKREGELVQYAWHFTTRQKAREFALRMNEMAKDAIAEIRDGEILSQSSRNDNKLYENEFSYRGKTYVAVEDEAGYACGGCALARMNCYKLMNSGKIPPCRSAYRLDGDDVIFAEKGA